MEGKKMKIDFEKIALLSIGSHEENLKPTLIKKEADQIARDPDAVRERIHEDYVVHGTGLSYQLEIVLTGLVKASSLMYHPVSGDLYDHWPVVSLEEFQEATKDWVRRSEAIGEDLPEYLRLLQEKGLLHICRFRTKIFFCLTEEAVLLLLKTVGLEPLFLHK